MDKETKQFYFWQDVASKGEGLECKGWGWLAKNAVGIYKSRERQPEMCLQKELIVGK